MLAGVPLFLPPSHVLDKSLDLRVVLTDVEMPRLAGARLTCLCRRRRLPNGLFCRENLHDVVLSRDHEMPDPRHEIAQIGRAPRGQGRRLLDRERESEALTGFVEPA